MNSKEVDPFEEFEFRPLTDGLGFHNRANTTIKTPIEEKPSTIMAQGPTDNQMDLPPLRTPLPRKKAESAEPAAQPGREPSSREPSFEKPLKSTEVLKSLQKKPWSFVDEKSEGVRTIRTVNYDLSAVILDAMLLIALFLTCLIVLLMVTKVDLIASLTAPDANLILSVALGTLFLFLNWSYLVINRTFLGATPGEFVFDQRLGDKESHRTIGYVGLVLARSTIILLSGLVLFPLVSLALGYDLLGRWLGIELQRS